MRQSRENGTKRRVFMKIWLRTGIPILSVTAVALYLIAGMVLGALELLGGQRVELNGTELALILSEQDLADQEAVEGCLNLEQFHMIGILLDEDGNKVAETDLSQYEEGEQRIQYQNIRERLLDKRAGTVVDGLDPFDKNYWYGQKPVLTQKGVYRLCYGGVTSTWVANQSRLLAIGAAILAVMVALTLCIAHSYYRIYKKQQAVEAAFGQQVNQLAHNLKTPMMVISGYAENLMAGIQTEKRTQYTEKILENVNKMNAIVDEMLEFTGRRQIGSH